MMIPELRFPRVEIRQNGELPGASIHPALPANAGEDIPGFVEYWRMVLSRKTVLLLFMLAAAGVATGLALLRSPLYEGHLALEVQEANVDFLNLRAVDPTAPSGAFAPDSYVSTQARVLESRALVETVVDELKLADSPEFHRDKRLTNWLIAAGISADWAPWFRKLSPRERAVEAALESLHIKTTPGNRIVEITFDWPDPELAARFANLLASAFIAQTIEARWNSSQSTGEWLISQLETTRTRLESLEAELQAYSQSSGLLFTAEKDNVADERLRQIQAELSRAQADRAIRESSYKLSQGSPDALPEVQDSTRMKEHNARLTDMRRELAELSLTRTPAHYQVIRLKAQIDEQERAMSRDRSDILSRIKNEFDRAVEREDLLKGAYEAQGKVVADQAGRRAHYNVLMREVETSRRIYDGMLERVRDASVAATIRASNIRVVDPATPQTRPAKPKLFLNAVGGCFSGLLLAFAYIIFGERANQAFRSAEDMPRLLGTRGLGVIPSGRRLIGRRGERLKLAVSVLPNLRRSDNGDRPESLDLVAWQERPSTFAESFRTVWASVMFNAGSANRPAVLVLTSPAPREGKTTVSTNLAIALAELGMRVVLLDCDLRQPRLHKVFGVSNSWGITSLVNGDIALSDCPLEALTRSTEVPCLYVTTSGPGTATVSGVLMSTRFRELVTRLRKEFDAVLIDTPPVIEFADARIASRSADGVILVIRANQTNRADALTAAQLLTDDGIRIIGSVLNDWGPKTAGYRYKYGHFSS